MVGVPYHKVSVKRRDADRCLRVVRQIEDERSRSEDELGSATYEVTYLGPSVTGRSHLVV